MLADAHPLAPDVAPHPGWEARLRLGFARRGDRTVLCERHHRGPLAFQKPLYPEGDAVCHGILLHPPAGIAGGDLLHIEVRVGEGAHALLTTPGAGKWYRSSGPAGQQNVGLQVAADGVLEWLPQESIVFDGARARAVLEVALAAGARFIGQEMVCLGRTARGERFTRGQFESRIRVTRDGAPLFRERAMLGGDDARAHSVVGLGGCPAWGTLLATHDAGDEALIHALRALAPAEGRGAITRLPGLLVARWHGTAVEAGRHWFAALRAVMRPALLGRTAHDPRIWST